MDRRRFLLSSLVGSLAVPLAAEAQQVGRVARVGVLWVVTAETAASLLEAFRHGLRERGYVERQNVIVENRYAEGRLERMAEIAAEFVRMRVDVIVAATDAAIAAVKRQTQSIPIVMVGASDPVGTGFVASLAHPGGNVTGSSRMSPELSGKRLEFLIEADPRLSRIAVMWNPDVRGALLDFKGLEDVARALHLQIQSVEVSRPDDLSRAFSAIMDARAQAMIVITPNAVTFANRAQLVSFLRKNRLPSIYGSPEYVEAGGLMAYGPSNADLCRRAAVYVDRILKGSKPGDLAVDQPTKFELVINLKTAKALGLTIPPSLLARADQVIQ